MRYVRYLLYVPGGHEVFLPARFAFSAGFPEITWILVNPKGTSGWNGWDWDGWLWYSQMYQVCRINEKKKDSRQYGARKRLPSSRTDRIRRVMGEVYEQEAKEITKKFGRLIFCASLGSTSKTPRTKKDGGASTAKMGGKKQNRNKTKYKTKRSFCSGGVKMSCFSITYLTILGRQTSASNRPTLFR